MLENLYHNLELLQIYFSIYRTPTNPINLVSLYNLSLVIAAAPGNIYQFLASHLSELILCVYESSMRPGMLWQRNPLL